MARKMKCKHCGSTRVFRDAWTEWDEKLQEWVIQNVFDDAFCEDCDGECTIVEEEITP